MRLRTNYYENKDSDFSLMISFELTNGEEINFFADGATGYTGRLNYFDGAAMISVSPKQLGSAPNVDKLIELLTNGVFDYVNRYERIFEKSNPQRNVDFYADPYRVISNLNKPITDDEYFDAYDFIKEIRASIHTMDDISAVILYVNETGWDGSNFVRVYGFDRTTKKYQGIYKGEEVESEGGVLELSDLYSCDIKVMK